MALSDGQIDSIVAEYDAIRTDLETVTNPSRYIKGAINALLKAKQLLLKYKTLN